MKTENAIIIENHKVNKFVVPVTNFSDKNVKKAISKALGIDENNLQCLASSLSYGLYGVKHLVPSIYTRIEPVFGLGNVDGYYNVLNVTYAKFVS